MKILVCIKKILADEGDIFIKDNGIEKECLIYKFNPHDMNAFCEGIAVKKNHTGSVLDVVTVDGSDSESFIRLLLVSGGDNGHRLWDAGLAEGTELNNTVIAEILSNFIQANKYDLVMFGSRSEYFGAGSLPIIVGYKLGIPAITHVTQIVQSNDGMWIHKMLEKGRRVVYRCKPKLVLSFECCNPVGLQEDMEKLIKSHAVPINVVPFRDLGIKESFIKRNIDAIGYCYAKPRTKYVLVPESDNVEDRLGFLMGGGIGKKDSGVIEGEPSKVAEEICKNLIQRNLFKGTQICREKL